MERVILCIGSNIEPEKHIEEVKEKVKQIPKTTGWLFSTYYYSLPDSFTSDNVFINVAAYCETELTPQEFLEEIHKVEEEMGRVRDPNRRYMDRVIDIDIIFWGNSKINEKDLVIPHPKWKERHFILNPIKQLVSEHKFIKNYFNYLKGKSED